MDLYNIITTLLVGAIAGWIAGLVMNSRGGLIRNIILGIGGGIVGNVVFGLLHLDINVALGPINVGTIIVAAVGSCIVIAVANLLFN